MMVREMPVFLRVESGEWRVEMRCAMRDTSSRHPEPVEGSRRCFDYAQHDGRAALRPFLACEVGVPEKPDRLFGVSKGGVSGAKARERVF